MSTSDKLLGVFRLFTLENPEWTVEAAADQLGLSVSTTYRFFHDLNDAGLISAFSTGRYVLGPAIVELDRQTRLLDPLLKAAQPVMARVVSELQIPGVLLLCRLFRDQVMCTHQESTDRPMSTVSYERGRPMPLYRGAASKVILANLPARFVRAFHQLHQAEMAAAGLGSDWKDVKARLRRLRAARVCITGGELDPGMTGLAAALHNPAGAVDGSLGFVLPDSCTNPKRLTTISEALCAAASEIDGRLERLAAENGDLGRAPERLPTRRSAA